MEQTTKYSELGASQRQAVYMYLYANMQEGVLKHGSVTACANLFAVDKSTVSRLWRAVNLRLLELPPEEREVALRTTSFFSGEQKKEEGPPMGPS